MLMFDDYFFSKVYFPSCLLKGIWDPLIAAAAAAGTLGFEADLSPPRDLDFEST